MQTGAALVKISAQLPDAQPAVQMWLAKALSQLFERRLDRRHLAGGKLPNPPPEFWMEVKPNHEACP